MLFATDNKNNLILIDGSPVVLKGAEEKAQYIKNFLLVDISEDENGLDIIGLFSPQLDDNMRANAIIERLEQCKYYKKLNSIEFKQEKENLIIKISLETNDDENIEIELNEI